jgi:hypothetical protein
VRSRSRRYVSYTTPDRVRRMRRVQTALLAVAALATAYLVALAIMKGQ